MTDFKLPASRRAPAQKIDGGMIWLYGPPKIGKTTFANQFPGMWFIATEKGHNWIETREPLNIETWEHFLSFCAWFDSNRPTEFDDGRPILWLCIDTIDGLFKLCEDFVKSDLGVANLGDMPHGKGWNALTVEFERVMNKIRKWDVGLIVISHATQKEFRTKGTKTDRWQPSPGAACYRWCNAAADLIIFCDVRDRPIINQDGVATGVEEQRFAVCHPVSSAVAGGRMSDRLPQTISLSYDAFVNCFPETTLQEDSDHD